MMTQKERFLAAMTGKKVDRVPIWLREGFDFSNNFPDEQHFTEGWKADPLYKDLHAYVTPHCAFTCGWQIHGFNRQLMIPEKHVEVREHILSNDTIHVERIIHTPKKDITHIQEIRRGFITTWGIKEAAETVEDLVSIIEVPFEIDEEKVTQDIEESYKTTLKQIGDRGVLNLFISSPIVIVSGTMNFQNFLEMTLTENKLLHELLKEIIRRNLILIDRCFKDKNLDTIVTLGGSEQCTPPMMSPHAFDEFVVPYDGLIVKRLKEYGIPVQCHCHGKVKHALPLMSQIGYDSTDPVEPPPAGDVTYEEARRLADGKITLLGNLEWNELEYSEPAQIRKRVKDILSLGSDRLILAASAGPISKITKQLADNYKTWIDAVNEFYT